ncbi:YaaC family protein [Acidiphilium acidophilum]|uniref:YaaC family protein n=1 Tax=Acidiphilium acidophilum TaxID=76588 RepID=UPI002E8E659A|nr:YaaC family protein [Acidiphilium acidophilum]
MPIETILFGTKVLRPHKAVRDAQFEVRTVLTTNPFNYVDLWLRRKHMNEALFYWRQAQAFYRASQNLQIESAPLVLYYCFMNAAKALLSAKSIKFDPHHGVSAERMRGPNSRVVLSNEGIKIKGKGIVPSLSIYFGEMEKKTKYSLENVLHNLVFIHRTYGLSYPKNKEQFLPLKDAEFVRDSDTAQVRFRAKPVDDADWQHFRRVLPPEVVANPDGSRSVLSVDHIDWASRDNPTAAELDTLRGLNTKLRTSVQYINGAQTLWYLKTAGKYEIKRQSITLTLAAMHRLSEICRYRPAELDSFLNGQKNWLLSEFVAVSSTQFLDEIACEMTGHQIMIPNVRAPI